jgi:16S rRNA (uracil1498-N3)-methyltransferase
LTAFLVFEYLNNFSMRYDRFFIDQFIEKGFLNIQDQHLSKQLKNVLRKKRGENVVVFDGSGREAFARIHFMDRDRVQLKIFEIIRPIREPEAYVALFCSVLKKDNFELVCQKATEIGAKEIVPVLNRHSVKSNLNLVRLKKIIQEAAEQSGRVTLPQLQKIIPFREAILYASSFDKRILFDFSGESLQTGIYKNNVSPRVALFIGPEGGFSLEEVNFAKINNFQILNLGQLNLRAETAAIVSIFWWLSSNKFN